MVYSFGTTSLVCFIVHMNNNMWNNYVPRFTNLSLEKLLNFFLNFSYLLCSKKNIA